MSKQSGPNNRTFLSSAPVGIPRKRTGFFDMPADLPETTSTAEARSAPSSLSSEQLDPQFWFTLPPLPQETDTLDPAPSNTAMIIHLVNCCVLKLTTLQGSHSNLSSSPHRNTEAQQTQSTSTSSSSTSSHSLPLQKRLSFNKRGSKAEIVQSLKTKMLALLASHQLSPNEMDDKTLAKKVHTFLESALSDLKSRFEFNKATANEIKETVQGFIEELKPFLSPSSAPTSARSSYRA